MKPKEKKNSRSRTLVLWLISIGLLAGMIITFTPNLGFGGQDGSSSRGSVQMTVNGQEIRDLDIEQMRRNPLFSIVLDGKVGQDLNRLMADEIIRQSVLLQAASRFNITNAKVNAAVNDFRVDQGVDGRKNDSAYQQLIMSAGFTDEMFRQYMRQQLQIEAFEDSIAADITVSADEVETFYIANQAAYQTDERIVARQIVVADPDAAGRLRYQLMRGADARELAEQHSIELAEQGGALGASGDDQPRPVGRAALPSAASAAAFALQGAGITDVVEVPAGYAIIVVEEYIPAETQPFDEVKAQVEEDALEAKRAAAVQTELERLRYTADVQFTKNSTIEFTDPVVAKVGDREILESEVDRALYMSPMVQQSLNPDNAEFLVAIFKPSMVGQLIDTELAYRGASELGAPFIGTRNTVGVAALNYIARDVTVSEADIEEYYDLNRASYTIPAEAVVTSVSFEDEETAETFREAYLAGGDIMDIAGGGLLQEHGLVRTGDLRREWNNVVFNTDAFDFRSETDPVGVSDIVVITEEVAAEDDEEEATEVSSYTVLLVDRLDAQTRPLSAVHSQVKQSALREAKDAVRAEWLESLRDNYDVEQFEIVGLEDIFAPQVDFTPAPTDDEVLDIEELEELLETEEQLETAE